MLLNERQERFLKHLSVAREKRSTIAKYQRDFKVVYETARRDLAELERHGILQKTHRRRQFVYRFNVGFVTAGFTGQEKAGEERSKVS
jgi:DeoR/GlpR family transcriptional regulator of sugar metabolism